MLSKRASLRDTRRRQVGLTVRLSLPSAIAVNRLRYTCVILQYVRGDHCLKVCDGIEWILLKLDCNQGTSMHLMGGLGPIKEDKHKEGVNDK